MKRVLFAGLFAGGLLLALLVADRPREQRTVAQPVIPGIASTATPSSASPAKPFPATPALGTTNSAPASPVAQPASVTEPTAFAAFDSWAQRKLAGAPSADVTIGEALAWKRRQAMLELIETDPARALSLAVPFRWRQALPTNVTRHFEQWIDARGSFEVAMAESVTGGEDIVYRWAVLDGKRYQAFVHGRRLADKTQRNAPLHGIALGGKIALTPDAVRMIETDEAKALEHARGHAAGKVCAVCGQAAKTASEARIGEIGGETRLFCSEEHAQLVNRNLIVAADGGSGPAPNAVAGGGTSWTQGRKDVLYMRVNFPDDLTEPNSETAAYSAMTAVNQFYVDNTYNEVWLSSTVTPLLTLPQVKGWYATAGPFALLSDAREVARKAGFDTDNYNFDIVSHTTVPGFDWCGLGFLGAKGTWLQCSGAGVTAHELGHNFGVIHANLWIPDAAYTSIHGTGANKEYGNIFDTMGNATAGNNQFNSQFKNTLGWLPAPAIHNVTTNGVYRLHALDAALRTPGRFYAATVRKDFDRDYWIEFRNRFTGNVSLQNGLLLNWDPWSVSGGVELLDATPATATLNDAAVVIGRTFSDALAGVHITPLARGATGTDPWIDVRINLETANPSMPCCLKVEVDPPNATPGQLVRFHATVADRDDSSFAYAWSFDDGTFSTNNQPWAYKSWTTTGEHVVRCEVSDMRGGRASANVIATVGAASGFRVSGVVLDENSHALEDVFVKSTFTNANNEPVTGFTDSDGAFVLAGVEGQFDVVAAKYGYTFSPVGWANPLNIVSNIANADFVAQEMTNVTLTLSTNLVAENILTTNQFVLTRSGDGSNDLTIDLYLSGSANVPGDLVITPPLLPGVNSVVIPAGTNRLVFSFSPVNDGTVEGTEVAYVTVRDSAAYVIKSQAEARISILDDDQAALPAVTVTALDGVVLENGMNSAGFLVTRTGSTAGALAVNFTDGGTATAGTDYAALLGTVIIPAGSASAIIDLQVQDDKDVEPNETVSVTLSSSPTYSISGGSASETILDDDVLVVTVTPTQNGLSEPGTSGRFTVKRDGDQLANLVVNYTLTGSASNGVDYVSPSGSVTIPAGVASADVVITALDDALVEGDESVTLVLSTNAAYDIGTPGSATLTLVDNEKVTVAVAAQDDAASEPGSDFGSITVSRGPVTSGDLTVNLAISGTAIPGSDYLPLDNPVVIPDGSSSVTLTVIPFDDLHWEEPIETVIVTLVASTNYNLGSPRQASVGIADDETSGTPAVGFCFSTFAALESESPGLAVALSRTSSTPVTVQYQVIGGTATPADYTLTPGTLTFEPGERAKSIPLSITDDTLVEADETIRITLFNPTGATHDGIKVMTYTIKDDDVSSVSVTATDPTASEVGPVAGNFRITRTGGTNASLLVNYQITGTASAPSDFPALGTSVTIPAGVTFVDLPVVPVDDATVEMDENVTLTLISAPGGKIVAPGADTITILDANTNGLPVVTLTSTNRPSAVEGGTNGAFVLTRTGPTNSSLTVYLTTAGTATSGTDYAALPASVIIPAGQTSVTLPVVAVDDGLIEGEQSVLASVTVRDTYRVAFPGTARVMIQDNDQSVRIDASDFDAAEPGTNQGEFTFTRFGATNTAVQIFYTISGSAGNGTDYAAISNSIVIPAGSLTATLPITPLDDALVEGAEKVTLTLSANAAYTLGAVTAATVTITDDEPMVSLVASRTNILEGSQSPVVLTVRRGGNMAYEFTARLAVGGTAGYGVDYPAFATNVFFNCGVAAIDLLIFPTNELATEALETISATVLPDAAYSRLAPSNAVVAITDASTNSAPVVTITSPTTNRVYLLPTNVNMLLEANIVDDGDTNVPVTVTWTNISGPGTLVFGTPDQTNTTVSFTNGGEYVLRLTADDGQLSSYAEVTVIVGAFARLTNNPATSQLLHWTFDEGTGTNVLDASGNVRDGAIQGAAGWDTNGITGGALHLSGTNNFVRTIGDPGFLNGRTAFSLSCWAKAADSPATRGLFAADDSGLPTFTLATRTAASCGASSNVIEGTLATSCEEGRQVSAANVLTNGWQHLTVTWSNGLAPSLYINGELDQPGKHQAPLKGVLANCPQFLLGKGPLDTTNTFAGWVDEVRVFPWAMDAAEVGTFVAANFGAIVDVPTNITVQILTPVDLTGVVTDDGRPVPPGAVTLTWSQVSGPLPVPIPDPSALTNTVSFTNAGDYVFRLIADDGQVKIYADLPVTVVEPTQITAFASDGDAAELGPDPGEFTFTRDGDLAVELTVYFAMSGTASNGADFVQIVETNSVTFPVGSNTVIIPIMPFLDHRTEGDETVTLTVQSNLIYSISSGVATVTIHDSPYGQWNIANFTLEQLTDPTLSGEIADFDHDGLVNFAEYAANLNPKAQETNSPLHTALEINPGDSLNHITLTYTRRIPPTDAAYEVAVSTNLLTWQTGTNIVQELSATPDGNNLTETVKAQLVAPWPTGVQQFVTVRVWLLSTGP